MHHCAPCKSVFPALAALPFALAVAFTSQDAQASAFQLRENSTAALSRAFAGSGSAPGDVSDVYNNPAAMADFQDTMFQTDVTLIDFSTEFSGNGTYLISNQPITGNDGGNGGGLTPVPALFFTTPLNDRWHFGASITAPFGLSTEYNDGWTGRYESIKSEVASIATNLALSYTVSDNFSLGGSLIVQHTSATLTSAIDMGSILAAGGVPPGAYDGGAEIEGDDWGYGWSIGGLWKFSPNDRFGITYHSEINHTLDGTAAFTVPAAIAPTFASLSLFQNTGVQAELDTPATTAISYTHQVNDRLSLSANLNWTGWSSFKELAIVFDNPEQPTSTLDGDWDNTWSEAVGFDYKLNSIWTLRGGLAYDETPTQDATRAPSLPDGNRRWIAFGFGYQPNEALQFNMGYAHLFINDAPVKDYSDTGNLLVGNFENSADLFSFSGVWHF